MYLFREFPKHANDNKYYKMLKSISHLRKEIKPTFSRKITVTAKVYV